MSSPAKRNSLPLPSSLNAPPPTSPRSHGNPVPVSPSAPAAASSPTSGHFPHHSMHSPPMVASSTHAGGIQPSLLFFHPARPALQPQYSPQPSLASNDADHNVYPLATLPKRHSNAPSSVDDQDPVTDTTEENIASQKRIKQSKEALLPIGGSSSVRRPAPSGILPPSLVSPKKPTAGHRVRTSLDRVFGMSFDSMRNRSPSTPYDPNRLPDEERADLPYKPQSNSPIRFLTSSSRPNSPSLSASSHSPTPPPSFIATPPTPLPHPLSATPILKPGTSTPLKKHHFHPSRNHFFLGGRLLTGGDSPWAFIASLSLVIALSGLWFSTTCVFWWRGEGGIGPGGKAVVVVGAYMAALVISAMLATATTDPGILPRELDPDPPYPATSPSDGGVRAPMPRDLRVRNDVVRVKYCPTCKTYRPPRSSHCKMCDNCVDGCDHHCQWVNNCIGRRNYTTFFALLCFATTTLILIIITSALHLYLLASHSSPPKTFRHALSDRKGTGSAVVFALGVAVIWPVGALLAYHLRLLVLNVTTIEMLRNQAHKSLNAPPPPNPFSHGTRMRNCMAILCRPAGFSWLDAGGEAVEDRREVNPGVAGA